MKRLLKMVMPCALVVLFMVPDAADGQTSSSIGVGVAVPTGDLDDAYDPGWTVRGQTGISLVLVDAHLQAGWTRFRGAELVSTVATDDIDIYHAGVGARFGLGIIWVGANAAYFFGDLDDDGLGLFPEVGAHIGPLEAVVDYRIDGDVHWLGARVGLSF